MQAGSLRGGGRRFLRAKAGQDIAAAGTRGDPSANARISSAETGFAELTASMCKDRACRSAQSGPWLAVGFVEKR